MQAVALLLKGMAEPRDDGSDTAFYLQALDDNPIRKTPELLPGEPSCFGGKVALRHRYDVGGGCSFAPLDHHHIERAEALLEKTWPAVHRQFGELIREFQPMHPPNDTGDNRKGSMSHQPSETFGSVWATVNDRICLAQALVHELAHNKLFALGLAFEGTAPLFTNDPGELFDSPIRLDVQRPMAALFHGLYAFTHVMQLDLYLLGQGDLDDHDQAYVKALLLKNMNRVRIGLQIAEKCAKVTTEGQAYFNDALNWTRRCIAEGEKAVARDLMPATWLVIGPTAAGKTTLCRALANATGKKSVSLDLYCWDFWWQTPVIQQVLLKLFGESRRFLFNQTMKSPEKLQVLRNLNNKGVINEQVRDHLKIELLKHAIKNNPGSVIDTGSGHCVFSDKQLITKFKQALVDAGIPVVQVRPVSESGETLAVLSERLQARNADETELRSMERNIANPSYRTLSDYLLDSSLPTEQLVEQALQLLG